MKELIEQLADHLYCLNLPTSVDKKEKSEKVFKDKKLEVEFVPAISGKTYTSSRTMIANYKAQNDGMANIFQDAIDKGYEKIGVFEDDIEFTEEAEEVLEENINYLPDNWDAFTLGCLNRRFAATPIEGRVYKLRYADLGHCWFFKASMFQPMIDILTLKEIPYDNCISAVFSDFSKYNAYGILYKGIAYQREGYSDNMEKKLKKQEIS